MVRPERARPQLAGNVVEVEIGAQRLQGLLGVPDDASGLIIFAHGSGSGRLSPRNNYVAERLRNAGLATLLLDLLTSSEERDRRNVFDIGLLAERLVVATEWTGQDARTQNQLSSPKELVIVPGAGHLFEEPGTLDEVVTHAIRWFRTHLVEGSYAR